MQRNTGNKIVIIGSGFVGSTTAFALMQSGLVSKMALIDIDEEKAEGEVMDLNHGLPFVMPIEISVGDYSDCKDADIIIMAAGPSIKPGETRLDLANKNSNLMKTIMENIVSYTKDTVILIASNPVDILTYVAATSVDYDRSKIIGSGTVLDSARFRYLLSEHCNVDTRNIHGYIIGEHGDSEVPAWSTTNIAGIRIDNYCPLCGETCMLEYRNKIFENVKNAGYQILKKKGVSHFGVSLAIKRIVEAILRDENSILTVSSVIDGEYGLSGVALSVPTIVNRKGIHKVLELPIDNEELNLLKQSAEKLKSIIEKLNI
jgi:L-lactate dehydrogenase